MPTVAPSTVTLVDRQKKGTHLVFTLGQQNTTLEFQHRSHSSHSSHRSHSSHYSSRTAPPASSAPAPAPTATAVAELEGLVVVIKKLDTQKRSFSATTEYGLKFEFEYRDDTLVSQSVGTFARVDELLETAARLPLEAGQKVRVQWKSSADKKKRIATKIAVLS